MPNEDKIRKYLIKENKEYEQKISLGKIVYKLVREENLNQESLKLVYKEALDLFMKQMQHIDQNNVILRPWQEELMKYIENPSSREVIWVQGSEGCEGKSWFQEFVESKFGWNRVVSGMDIKVENANICHALRKRPLTTTDIFMFNDGKAKGNSEINYEMLEKIKDGKLLASKYDTRELRLRSPNVVVVFSNRKPKVEELAIDRWIIFAIQNNELVDRTKIALKQKDKSYDEEEY